MTMTVHCMYGVPRDGHGTIYGDFHIMKHVQIDITLPISYITIPTAIISVIQGVISSIPNAFYGVRSITATKTPHIANAYSYQSVCVRQGCFRLEGDSVKYAALYIFHKTNNHTTRVPCIHTKEIL